MVYEPSASDADKILCLSRVISVDYAMGLSGRTISDWLILHHAMSADWSDWHMARLVISVRVGFADHFARSSSTVKSLISIFWDL